MVSWLVLAYAILVAAGGAMGYFKAGSKASLVSGVAAGAILAWSSYSMMKGSYQTGWRVAAVITILMLGRFGLAATKGFKMMPGGVVIIMSLVVLAGLLLQRER